MPQRPLTAAARERVIAAVQSGATIEAIRLYRQDTLASLAEAKQAVELMEAARQAPAIVTPAGGDAAVVTALYAGRKIEAIKQYRLTHRVDLRQAKETVEAMEAELRRTAPERFAGPPASAGGCGGRTLILAGLAAAVGWAAWHFLR